MNLNKKIDIIVKGEGEKTFKEIIKSLIQNKDFTKISGTICRVNENSILDNGPQDLIDNLDEIPEPYDEELEKNLASLHKWNDFVVYETMRGCPYDCGFCLYGGGLKKVRFYSVDRVVSDLFNILKAGLKIQIIDSIFGLNKKRILKILDSLIQKKPYRGKITIEAHAELLDDEIIERLSEVQTMQIGLGLQTICEDSYTLMKRRFNPEKFKETLDKLSKKNLYHYVDIIFGMPGDTYANFLNTVDFALSSGKTDVQFHRLLIMPGTRFYREAKNLGIKFADDPPYEVLSTPTFSHNDIIKAHKIAFVFHLLHYAMGGIKGVGKLILLSKMKPSEFLIDLAKYLEEKGVLLTVNPYNIGDLSFFIYDMINDYLKTRGLKCDII